MAGREKASSFSEFAGSRFNHLHNERQTSAINRAFPRGLEMIRFVLCCLAILVATALRGESLSFDFNDGIEPHFDIINSGDLWEIETTGPGVRIHKPADDGSVLPTDFIPGIVRSRFSIDGDFSVTVDFVHNEFPIPNTHFGLNESILGVDSAISGQFEILRFSIGDGREKIETFMYPAETPGFVVADEPTGMSGGKYRLSRTGDKIAGSYALTGETEFHPLGNLGSFFGPVFIEMKVTQGRNRFDVPRSTTAMDIGFDNLIVEADTITSVPPIWGDTNNDGVVSLQDLNNVRNHFGDGIVGGPPVFGEAYPFDGVVDLVDVNLVRNRFGTTAFSPVPEPAELVMLLAGGMWISLLRRR